MKSQIIPEVGDIVTSKITGHQILVTKVKESLIIGQDVNHKPIEAISNGFRTGWNGTRILSFKNILELI